MKRNELGLKFYFTGERCKNGHIDQRYVLGRGCKTCRLNNSRDDFLKNREKHREKSKAWYSNKERSRKKTAEWRAKNPERNTSNTRKWRENNKEKVKSYSKKWAKNNPEKIKQFAKSWQDRNLDWYAAKERNRRALKRNSGGVHTKEDVVRIFKAQGGKCAYCKCDVKDGYDVDHIMPLILGGSNDKTNLQITCESCNLRKHAKHPIAFARELGMLL